MDKAERIRELEAERDDVVAQLHIALASVGHNQGVAEAIRAKTIEECAKLVDDVWLAHDMANAIRALSQTDEGKT
jgi:hypothetical protein